MEYHLLKWVAQRELMFALVYKTTRDLIGVDDILYPAQPLKQLAPIFQDSEIVIQLYNTNTHTHTHIHISMQSIGQSQCLTHTHTKPLLFTCTIVSSPIFNPF
ncbi:hypothetical protein Dimus_018125 [Dionaea muscipula]